MFQIETKWLFLKENPQGILTFVRREISYGGNVLTKSLVTFLIIISFNSNVLAAFGDNVGANNGPVTCSAGYSYSSASRQCVLTSTGVSVNATQSQKDSGNVNIAGIVMAALLMTMCPQNPAACVMAGMALADALMAKGNGSNSGVTNAAVGGTAGGTGSAADTSQTGTTGGLTAEQQADAQAQLKRLEAMGYKFDGSTGTVGLPGGGTVKGSSLTSPAALQAAGLSASDAQKFANQFGELKDKYAPGVSTASVQEGVPTGGPVGASGEPINDNHGSVQTASVAQAAPLRDVTSLNRRLGDDLIGVSASDIFIIVNKKYQEETDKGSFHRSLEAEGNEGVH